MRGSTRVGVLIPACDSSDHVGAVVAALPDWVDDIVVVGVSLLPPRLAAADVERVRVVSADDGELGAACLSGVARLRPCDIVVMLDPARTTPGDELERLIDPIVASEAELTLGTYAPPEQPAERARAASSAAGAAGAATGKPALKNPIEIRFACWLMRMAWGVSFTDVTLPRAIRRDVLTRLETSERGERWLLELQIKAAQRHVRTLEVPLAGRRRMRRSSGGMAGAAGMILRAALGRRDWRDSRLRVTRPRVILWTHYPAPGRVKPHLIPQLGVERSTALHDALTLQTLSTIAPAIGRGRSELEVRFDGGDAALVSAWLGNGKRILPQGDGDFGQRLARSATEAFAEGCDAVVFIGGDCPQLSAAHISLALDRLQTADVVLGPTTSGGLYLVALRAAHERLFDGLTSTADATVVSVLARAAAGGLRVHCIETLATIDRPQDLELSPLSHNGAATAFRYA